MVALGETHSLWSSINYLAHSIEGLRLLWYTQQGIPYSAQRSKNHPRRRRMVGSSLHHACLCPCTGTQNECGKPILLGRTYAPPSRSKCNMCRIPSNRSLHVLWRPRPQHRQPRLPSRSLVRNRGPAFTARNEKRFCHLVCRPALVSVMNSHASPIRPTNKLPCWASS
jgi:hypothetical protein